MSKSVVFNESVMYHASLCIDDSSDTSDEEQPQVSVQVEHLVTIENDGAALHTHIYDHDIVQHSLHVCGNKTNPLQLNGQEETLFVLTV